MKSRLFHAEDFKVVQNRVLELINSRPTFLSDSIARSPRAVGDAMATLVAESFEQILGTHCGEYSSSFARRAMADVAFKDPDGLYYVVDVKTHRADTKFNIPNLTSVERLARFYEDSTNYFVVLLIRYFVEGLRIRATEAVFAPIEFLGWNCLTIGALGWGQIQIADSNFVTVNPGYSRRRWMLELCEVMLEFYPKEIMKITDRIKRFEQVREFWLERSED